VVSPCIPNWTRRGGQEHHGVGRGSRASGRPSCTALSTQALTMGIAMG
jgi:hypothetical protein